MRFILSFICLFVFTTGFNASLWASDYNTRPINLISAMKPGPLKDKLLSCRGQTIEPTFFSIGHRGAPLKFPEHTKISYTEAANMGAGVLECDVTFTKDNVLVCRHSQNDLHTTTNILDTPFANKCQQPFEPATLDTKANAECLASDITYEEFKTLHGKSGKVNKQAKTVAEFLDTEIDHGELLSHAESIQLLKSLNVKFMPELKKPSVDMPFNGLTQQEYAQQLVDEYRHANIPPNDVFLQSFNLQDVLYWINQEPDFGKQAIYLDGRFRKSGFNHQDSATFTPSMAELKALGINYISPPLWMLVTLEQDKIVPSIYAKEARAAGLKIIAWTVERSGSLTKGGGWYYQSIKDIINNDSQVMDLIHVLAQDVKVEALFSDWPATTSYYANCMNIQ